MYILAIESSCDDTSVAILQNNEVVSNVICNQSIHNELGGVVPELASRDHLKNIIPAIDAAIKQANVKLNKLNAIAVTKGPGLIGSLMVGISAAKSLSIALNIPLIEINHLQAHILAHFIKDVGHSDKLHFPFIGLIVSGGHTQLLKINDYLEYEVLGKTLDDAAGEALDKGAKLLGCGFPGGPIIDQLSKNGNESKFDFPLSKVKPLHFSFSGIKTALLYLIQNEVKNNPHFVQENLNDICASYQKNIVQMLINGIKECIENTKLNKVAIAGGVSANSKLRQELLNLSKEMNMDVFTLPTKYCTDNAAMVGIAAYFKYLKNDFASLEISPVTSWEGFFKKN